MRKGIFFAVISACAVALVASGCGGGGGVDEVTASSLNKAEYIRQASAICEKANKKIETDFGVFLKEKQGVTKPTEADFDEFLEKVVTPNIEPEIEELRALGAPKDDVAEVEAMLKAREESLEKAEEDPQAVINNRDAVFGKASELAKKYGVTVCGAR